MAIGDLSNKVSMDDVESVRDLRNPPEFEPGFGDSNFGDSDDIFGGSDDIFGNSDDIFGNSNDIFGESNNSNDIFGGSNSSNDIFGSSFGNTGFGNNGFGNTGFGNTGNARSEPDRFDKAMDALWDSGGGCLGILSELAKSIKTRTADDFGYLSSVYMQCGFLISIIGLVLGIIGGISKLDILYLSGGIAGHGLIAGLFILGTGLSGLGFSAIQVAKTAKSGGTENVKNIPDIHNIDKDDAIDEYEENIDDMLEDLFGNDDEDANYKDDFDFDNELNSLGESNRDLGIEESKSAPVFNSSAKIDFGKEVENVQENAYLSRELLFNTFKNFLPYNTPDFAKVVNIDEKSDTFAKLEAIALKALCNVAKCELQDIKSKLESAKETFFSYELRLKRIKGIKNTDEIAREMEAYFRESSTDTSVNATVDIEGDFYKVIVTKGESAVVTFGDVFNLDYAREFFLDTKNKLPIITGIDELGKVILDDAKVFDSMVIAGKPRSGKSWYVLSILMCLALFNTPEDVSFVIIDPKESNLFNTFSLLPHVAGLHNDDNVLEVMDDIIENEAPRRKKLLADNRCDDIWALRSKGIKLPVLYLIMDEYITIRNNLGILDKELDIKLQTIISQLPSLGIRLLAVPHRVTGVVNKTNRTMLQYTASVKGDVEDVKDTLGINKWTRSLTKPGDIAIKTSTMQNAMYVRGAALTTSDEENTELIRNVAKAFYKMGVDLPDNSAMRVAAVRNEKLIREELQENSRRVQFSSLDFDKD